MLDATPAIAIYLRSSSISPTTHLLAHGLRRQRIQIAYLYVEQSVSDRLARHPALEQTPHKRPNGFHVACPWVYPAWMQVSHLVLHCFIHSMRWLASSNTVDE